MATIRSEVATGRRINGRDGLNLELMTVDPPHPRRHSTQPKHSSPEPSAETPSPRSSASPGHPQPPGPQASLLRSKSPACLPSTQHSPAAPAPSSSTGSPEAAEEEACPYSSSQP